MRVHQSATALPTDAGWIDLVVSPQKQIDLLTLQNGVLSELGQIPLLAGRYQQMRLVLTQANTVTPSSTHVEVPLTTPSGLQTGAKMNVDLAIAADKMADFVIDFKVCESIVPAGPGNYLLKPVLSVSPRYLSGVLGFVDPALANGNSLVTLQQGGVVVRATSPDATGRFLLQPVAPGTYDLVLTAPGRSSAVVASIPVTSETVTSVNTSTTQLHPQASAGAGTANGTLTTTASPNDGVVRVLQALSGGPTVQIAGKPVATDGSYAYSLVIDAPQLAAYASGAALSFAANAGSAAKYGLEASSLSTTKPAVLVTMTSGGTVTTNFTFP